MTFLPPREKKYHPFARQPSSSLLVPTILKSETNMDRPKLSRERRYYPYHLLEDDTLLEPHHQTASVGMHKALLLAALILSLYFSTFLAIRHYHSRFRDGYDNV